MKRALKWLLPLLAAVLVVGFALDAVEKRRTQRSAVATATQAEPGLDLAPSDVVVARTIELPRTLEISGGLKAVNSAIVKARVAGDVKSLTVREGDRVKAGQVLGQIDTTELDWKLKQAELAAASSRSQLEIATRTLDNNRALVAQGFISPNALETSISTEAGARATYGAAKAAAELARKSHADARLVAPIDGLVSQRLVQPGERVGVDTKLIEIVDLAQLELEAAIAPENIVAMRIGQHASLQVDGIDTPLGAKVVRINPSAQTGTRSIVAYLAVDPNAALRQGLFARGTIELDRKRTVALPLSAVRTDQARPYVLQVQGGRAVAAPVQLGERGTIGGESWVEIVSGVADGTPVLAGSAGLVRDGTPVHVAPAAHPGSAASAPRV